MNFSGTELLVRSLTVPLTWVTTGLPALITETLITPWFLLRTRPADLAMSGCRKVEIKVL
ncbi:hypothetical protein D3C79_1048800 [compost metagenome]